VTPSVATKSVRSLRRHHNSSGVQPTSAVFNNASARARCWASMRVSACFRNGGYGADFADRHALHGSAESTISNGPQADGGSQNQHAQKQHQQRSQGNTPAACSDSTGSDVSQPLIGAVASGFQIGFKRKSVARHDRTHRGRRCWEPHASSNSLRPQRRAAASNSPVCHPDRGASPQKYDWPKEPAD